MKTAGRFPRWLALAIVAICLAIAVFAPASDPFRRSAARLHDFLHVPGFGGVAVVLWLGFPGNDGTRHGRRILRLLAIFAVTVALGAGVEIAQAAIGGDADPWDLARDGLGAASAVLALASAWRAIGAPARWGLRAAALAGVLAGLVPTASALADEMRAVRQFPVLADFSAKKDLDRFGWSPWSTGEFEPPGAGDARGALRLDLTPGAYPGLWLEFFPRDWRGRQDLSFDCTNPAPTPFRVTVRIDDLDHGQDYHDRFNRAIVLAPGRNTVRIPLADVESAPRGRRLDLSKVRSVGIFAVGLRERRTLRFHEFRLAP
jgi:hypothetical protein